MIVWRVEKDGRGPYHLGCKAMDDIYNNTKCRPISKPTPSHPTQSVFNDLAIGFNSPWLFGFIDLEQYINWFDHADARKILSYHGFQLIQYFAPIAHYSPDQAVFDKRVACLMSVGSCDV